MAILSGMRAARLAAANHIATQEERTPVQLPRRITVNRPVVSTPEPPAPRARARHRRTPEVEEQLTPNFLTSMLVRQDGRSQPHRIGTEYVHVSSLLDLCTRQHYLAAEDHVQPTQPVTGGHRVMYEIGRAVEKNARDKIIKDRNFAGVYGRWTCVCKFEIFDGFHEDFGPCPKCGHPRDVYKEWTFFDPDAEITGNPDLLLFIAGRLLVIEIKSMNGEEWNELAAAKPDHVFQAHSYRKMAMVEGWPVAVEVIVLYVTKKFKYGVPYKEYHVPVTQQISNILNLSWSEAEGLAEAKATKTIPARVCTSNAQTRAKNCPVMGPCFTRSR